jgi:polysaccharide export outer membrane protein
MKRRHWIWILAAIVLTTGCNTPRKLSYLRDLAYDTPYPAKPAPELVLQKGDQLDIRVFSSTPELTAPFQTQSGASEVTAGDLYTVDRDGYIDFPVLGPVHVEGKTPKETEVSLSGLIRTKGFIKEPTVRVTLANFSVTVVGSAGNTVIPVDDNSINLLQVIARSGGTQENNNIREVTVIRTEKDIRMAYKVNLQSRELFDSPAFYLQQHDVVYIKPEGYRLSSTGQSFFTFMYSSLTLTSIITNFILWSKR